MRQEINKNLLDQMDQEKSSLEKIVREESDYKFMTDMFGRSGVPSRIVELAIPELEERTNDFLYLLTDGELRVSLRTTKTSGKDTLEIDVIEKSFIRPYETYSGGQSFRINFAIRLALSQLLASANKIAVQFLVVDEGFGSQDINGRQHVIDCIEKVRDHFDCILVISHMEDIKERFAIRFEVTRDDKGSRIQRV
jgi:exonuclease SbcC